MSKERVVWGSKLDFILSTLGYAVGLGNIWRFPFYCGRNGGAAFLIAYVIMMIFAGLPVFYMELSIGQYNGNPPHLLWGKVSPFFVGIGYSMIIISTYISIYYNMVVGWALYYFGFSCFKNLPYASCLNSWNNLTTCYDYSLAKTCSGQNLTYAYGDCQNITDPAEIAQITENFLQSNQSPSSQFWNNRVLKISAGIDEMGSPDYQLVLCLLAAWIIVGFVLINGIKSAGKTVYFTTTFPYIIIIILIVRGCTLKGAYIGIDFYLKPHLEKLQNSQVWLDAAVQIFFSLGVGLGGLGTLASYNDFHNNAMRDTIIVVFGNCLTSFICGFAIFPILGHLAYGSGQDIAVVADQGPGLAFVAYPTATSQIAAPQLWGVLFFLVLILLGVNTEQVNVEVVITAITDTWPVLRKRKYRALTTAAVCTGMFLVGVCLTTPGGAYVLNLMDKFASGWAIAVVALVEIIVVSWVYGISNFIQNLAMMMGLPPNTAWKICGYPVNIFWYLNWVAITPALLIFILLYSWIKYEPIKYDTYVYPDYAQGLGWMITVTCLLPIMIGALYQTHKYVQKLFIGTATASEGTEVLKPNLFRPTLEWGPNKKRFDSSSDSSSYSSSTDTASIKDFDELDKPTDSNGNLNQNESIWTTKLSNDLQDRIVIDQHM